MSDLMWRKASACESHACLMVAFRRSSLCEHNACVEVGATVGRVYVRDSKLPPSAQPLSFQPAAWRAFTDAIKEGDF